MKKGSFWSTVFLVACGMIIGVFVLFSTMLAYVMLSSPQESGEPGKTFLVREEDGRGLLLFLEKNQNYEAGNYVLVKNPSDLGAAYYLDTIAEVQEDRIMLSEIESEYWIPADQIAGLIHFESYFFGGVLQAMQTPEYTTAIVLVSIAVFLLIVSLICAMGVVISRRKRSNQDSVDDSVEKRLERLFSEQESSDVDFIQEVFRQEIREPEELSSVGDDKEPMSEDDIAQFRHSVLGSE